VPRRSNLRPHALPPSAAATPPAPYLLLRDRPPGLAFMPGFVAAPLTGGAAARVCGACRRRTGQQAAGSVRPVGPSLAGVASSFADYAVSVLEGAAHDGEGAGTDAPQHTPATAPRRSALDALRWNAGASVGAVARRAKRQKTDDKSQLYLDFGQRNFYQTKCAVCDMCYCPGLASDEKLHDHFHKRVTHGIIYKGFKNQHAVETFSDGSYIVCVRRNDPAPHIAKADEVRQMAERELGAFGDAHEESVVMFLMISPERRAVGFLLAEPIRRAYRIVIPPPTEQPHRHAPSDMREPVSVGTPDGTAPEARVVSPARCCTGSLGSRTGQAPAGQDSEAGSRDNSATQGPSRRGIEDCSAAEQAGGAAACDIAAHKKGPKGESCLGSEASTQSVHTDTCESYEDVRASCEALVPGDDYDTTPGRHTAMDATTECPPSNPKVQTDTVLREGSAALSQNSDDDDDLLCGLDFNVLEAAALAAPPSGGGGEAANPLKRSGYGDDEMEDEDDDLDLDAIEAAALASSSDTGNAFVASLSGAGAQLDGREGVGGVPCESIPSEQEETAPEALRPASAPVHGVGATLEQEGAQVLSNGNADAEHTHAEPPPSEADDTQGGGGEGVYVHGDSGVTGSSDGMRGMRGAVRGPVAARAASACGAEEASEHGGWGVHQQGAHGVAGDDSAQRRQEEEEGLFQAKPVKAVEEGWVEDEGLGLRAEWLMSTEEEDSWDDDDSLLVSTEEEPAMCGIRLVWVHRSHRRRGVGIYIFSKVLYIGTLYSKYIGALTYEDFCRY